MCRSSNLEVIYCSKVEEILGTTVNGGGIQGN
jgi:hypothetical protein